MEERPKGFVTMVSFIEKKHIIWYNDVNFAERLYCIIEEHISGLKYL